jgi:branched-chain amino acid aminotransferase
MSIRDKYPIIWMDGTLTEYTKATLHITSASVLYGLSVYSVFPVSVTDKGLSGFRLQDHFARLHDSARIMGIAVPKELRKYESFVKSISKLIKANNINEDIFIRATIHVSDELTGTRSKGSATMLSMFIYPAKSILPTNGARLKTTHWQRVSDNSIPARAKVNGAYVNSVLGRQDALDSGYDDCIFLDSKGHVCELSAANVFLVKSGVLITPSTTSDILEGINRRAVIEYAKDLGNVVKERTVDLTELYIADEVFACGTSAFLSPVIEIDGRIIGSGKPGKITSTLSKIHNDTLHGATKSSINFLTNL